MRIFGQDQDIQKNNRGYPPDILMMII